MRVLIVETGASRGALAAARALGEAGCEVGISTPTGRGMASSSRAVGKRHRSPPPEQDVRAFADVVGTIVEENCYDIVFGGGDAEVFALSEMRDRIPAVIPHAEHACVVRAHDKLTLASIAASTGLASPRTVEATEEALDGWNPPYLLKASLHAPLRQPDGPGRLNPLLVEDRGAATRRASEIRAAGSVPFLQEQVVGRLLGCAVVADRGGKIVAAAAQVAEGTWPPTVGVSVRARSVTPDPKLFEGIARLLSELGWFGLAQLQFILGGSGAPQLIDFNGRFYGSLALAARSGVNLPAIWANLAVGHRVSAPISLGPGRRYQWLGGDFRRALVERRGGLLRDVAEVARYSPGAVHSVASLRDPMPLVHRLGAVPARALRRRPRPNEP